MKSSCVLLVNWNGWADTLECLESIFRAVAADVRVIVCDNDSNDGSVDKIVAWAEGALNVFVAQTNPHRQRSWPPIAKPVSTQVYDRTEAEQGGGMDEYARLVVIRTGDNLGFAGGNNVGLRYVLAENREAYIWLLNSDTVVEHGALDALIDRMEQDEAIGMCGSTLLHYHRPQRVQARGGGWYCKWLGLPWHIGQLGRADQPVDVNRVERRMNYIVGASLCVSRALLEKVGLMAEDYFLFFEETDWAMRAKDRFRLAYAPRSIVYHKIGQSIGTSSDPRQKSYICDYYALRNRLLFTRRYFPRLVPVIYGSLLGALLVRILFRRWDRVALIWRLLTGSEQAPLQPGAVRQ